MKKLLSMILVLCLITIMLPSTVFADSEVIATGTVESDLGKVDAVLTDDGTLTISGTGDMNCVFSLARLR